MSAACACLTWEEHLTLCAGELAEDGLPESAPLEVAAQDLIDYGAPTEEQEA